MSIEREQIKTIGEYKIYQRIRVTKFSRTPELYSISGPGADPSWIIQTVEDALAEIEKLKAK